MGLISKTIIVCLSAFGGALVTYAGFPMLPHNLHVAWLAFNVWMWIGVPCIVWAAKGDTPKDGSTSRA